MSINSRNKGASEIWKPVWKYEEAALALNCSDGSISRVCSGKQKQTKGMVFKYADDDRR